MAADLAASGLFDANYYLLNNPDVAEAGADPLAHFCRDGWREDRFPNPYFHPHWYRHTHRLPPDVPPLWHYLSQGEAAGHMPCRYFDPVWYAAVHALPATTSPLADYLARRRGQAVAPIPLFDPLFYCAAHAGQVRPGRDAFLHYLTVGAAQDWRPVPWFDAAAYRRSWMAGATERVPLLHWIAALGGRPWAALADATLLRLDTRHLDAGGDQAARGINPDSQELRRRKNASSNAG